MVLKLHPPQLQIIRHHAESTYPDECCGAMLGHLNGDGKTLVEVWAAENVWSGETAHFYEAGKFVTTKKRRYVIAPTALLQAPARSTRSLLGYNWNLPLPPRQLRNSV